jgi:hypothetical protein
MFRLGVNFKIINIICIVAKGESRDRAVDIAADYGLSDRGVGVRVPVGSGIFPSPCRPDWPRGPPSLLSIGYRGHFPRG